MKIATTTILAVALAIPASVAAQGPAPAAPEARRAAIRMMEAVLSRAVVTGAERLAAELANGNPNVSFFTGQARARGFVLDGYGVFFHVEIPEMQQSLVMSVATLERDLAIANALDSLQQLAESVPQGPNKLQAEHAFRRLQLLVGPLPQADEAVAGPAPPGRVRSAEAPAAGARPGAAGESVMSLVMRDPTAAYRQAITSALVDAMLEHSRGVAIRPDEWLSVAAHRGDNPLSPNEIVTSSTLVLRIKGSDLALYEADRTRKEEIRGRVEVREF
ncbi:MAG: hypothetical protein H0U94_01670 [Acidobacteria bacterium]|nr:hypothetical protein [Acidobacteriota bacterium]